jgi:hypothetical protein
MGVTMQNGGAGVNPGGGAGDEPRGGAIHTNSGYVEVTGCIFKGNTAVSRKRDVMALGSLTNIAFSPAPTTLPRQSNVGGAIYTKSGHVEVTGCIFNGNCAVSRRRGVRALGSLTNIAFLLPFPPRQPVAGGAITTTQGSSVRIVSCGFNGTSRCGPRASVDSIENYGSAVFACPANTTGTPYTMGFEQSLRVDELPPAHELVHCA